VSPRSPGVRHSAHIVPSRELKVCLYVLHRYLYLSRRCMTMFLCPIFPLAEHSRHHPLEASIWLCARGFIRAVCPMSAHFSSLSPCLSSREGGSTGVSASGRHLIEERTVAQARNAECDGGMCPGVASVKEEQRGMASCVSSLVALCQICVVAHLILTNCAPRFLQAPDLPAAVHSLQCVQRHWHSPAKPGAGQ